MPLLCLPVWSAESISSAPTDAAAKPIAIKISSTNANRVTRTARFEIDMRAEIVAGRFDATRDQIGVRGAAIPLSWSQTTLATPIGDGRFAVSIAFDRPAVGGQPLQYKFKIERPGTGANEGWEDGRNRVVRLTELEHTMARAFNSPPEPFPVERTGNIDRIAPLPSSFVGPREVQVWLPPGYERDRKRRYPVLYLHDGHVMFDAESAGAEWQFDETAQRLVLAGAIEPLIIVAIAATTARMDDYTPTFARSDKLEERRNGLDVERRSGRDMERRSGGGAPKYADYLIKELKPLIDRRYRTQPDAKHTAVGGSSLGGLVTMWLLLHHHDVFGAGLVVSPSVWWDDQFIVRDAATAPLTGRARPRVWLDMGAQEGSDAVPAARKLRDTLIHRGWNAGTLSYLEQADGTHDEASWALRVEGMLRYLYARTDAATHR